jgi:hypothetical protein
MGYLNARSARGLWTLGLDTPDRVMRSTVERRQTHCAVRNESFPDSDDY